MKKMLGTLLVLVCLFSSAFADCPKKTKLVAKCISTPRSVDSIIASKMFKEIQVCKGPTQSALLFVTVDGIIHVDQAFQADRVGGESYTVDGDQIFLSLDINHEIKNQNNATLLVKLTYPLEEDGTTTYSCR